MLLVEGLFLNICIKLENISALFPWIAKHIS